MNSILRFALALAVTGIVDVSLARAGEAPRFTVPGWVTVVGSVNQGAQPDPAGLATVTCRDPAYNPIAGALVTLDFSSYCDIDLCSAVSAGTTLDCSGKTISGFTNGAGQFSFTVLGAARDPGDLVPPNQYGGGPAAIQIRMDSQTEHLVIGISQAVCLDQNGAAPGRSNGTTGSDVSALITLYGSVAIGAPYQSRGDINQSGEINGADVGSLIAHLGRLAVAGGVGCTGSFCGGSGCP